jgi:NAD kinase
MEIISPTNPKMLSWKCLALKDKTKVDVMMISKSKDNPLWKPIDSQV